MSGGAISFRLKWPVDSADVASIFDALGEDLRDWSPAMRHIQSTLAEMFRKIFASQGAALGGDVEIGSGVVDVSGGWAPEARETLRRKMARGLSGATLHMTGALEASLANDTGARGAIRRIVAGREGLPRIIYGTSLPQAAPLHHGSSKRGLPPRPIVGITPDAREEIPAILNAELREKLARTAEALSKKGVGDGR